MSKPGLLILSNRRLHAGRTDDNVKNNGMPIANASETQNMVPFTASAPTRTVGREIAVSHKSRSRGGFAFSLRSSHTSTKYSETTPAAIPSIMSRKKRALC